MIADLTVKYQNQLQGGCLRKDLKSKIDNISIICKENPTILLKYILTALFICNICVMKYDYYESHFL